MCGRQIDRHVHIVEVENGEDARTGIHDLSAPMDQVLHSAGARREEREIDATLYAVTVATLGIPMATITTTSLRCSQRLPSWSSSF